jgi:hypothetical protein
LETDLHLSLTNGRAEAEERLVERNDLQLVSGGLGVLMHKLGSDDELGGRPRAANMEMEELRNRQHISGLGFANLPKSGGTNVSDHGENLCQHNGQIADHSQGTAQFLSQRQLNARRSHVVGPISDLFVRCWSNF